MIAVSTEPQHRLVRAVMGGMLTPADVQTFSQAEQAAVRSMGLGSGEFVLLVEAQGNQVQTQAVMEGFVALLHRSPLRAARIAVVRDGVLTRMQTRRVMKEREQAQVFDDVTDARAWLLAA